MGFFGFGKKKEETSCGCAGGCNPAQAEKQASEGCCGSVDAQSIAAAKENLADGASVKVLGSGCKKCNQLEQATKEALENLGMDTAIDHVTDFSAIASYGVMTTPALVVDGKVVSYGKVLTTGEVETILSKVRG